MIRAVAASSYDSRSITWHQWHHTAPISSRMGLSSPAARANASTPHSCQATGWCMAERKYEDAASASEFVESVIYDQSIHSAAGALSSRGRPICAQPPPGQRRVNPHHGQGESDDKKVRPAEEEVADGRRMA